MDGRPGTGAGLSRPSDRHLDWPTQSALTSRRPGIPPDNPTASTRPAGHQLTLAAMNALTPIS
jgi:hypothetical protein